MVEEEILLKRGAALGVGPGDVLFDQFGDDTDCSGIHVFGGRGPWSLGVELVDIDGFAVGAAFDGSGALIVVFVVLFLAVVGNTFDAVFFVPDDGTAGAVGVLGPASLGAVLVVAIGPV